MNLPQRLVLGLGCIGLLHSSMVPPIAPPAVSEEVELVGNEACRYHAFTLRASPFTREYATPDADLAALIGEYGMIVSATGILVLLLRLLGRRAADTAERAP